MTPFIAEIIGTALLILLGGGVVANVVLKKTNGNNSGWIVITTGWALAVAGKFSWELVPSYILAQMIGAMLGASLVWLMYKDHFDATENGDDKKAVFCTAPAIRNKFLNLLSEVIGTFVLVFTILNFTDASLNEPETIIGLGSLGALPVAFLVWAIGLSLGGTTGYAINPARDLGPRIAHAFLPIKEKAPNDWNYAWIPVLGPIIGAVIAALLTIILT
ncbi:MAG: aquaporin family protein [Flavobacteriaceae bacterium]|nr:aquaporin family protein [Flavobacteriaceae bacterium]